MRELCNDAQFKFRLTCERTLHVLTLGFEERCLAYPSFLQDSKLGMNLHKVLCIEPSDESVGSFLRWLRDLYRKRLEEMLSIARFASVEEISFELDKERTAENVCLDISAAPRVQIFRLLEHARQLWRGSRRMFIIYSYPRSYMYENLQDPSPVVKLVLDGTWEASGQAVSAIVIPGFDTAYATVALAHLLSRFSRVDVRWLIPFSERNYCFYERSFEEHLDLIGSGRVSLFPQDDLQLGFQMLEREIEALAGTPIFVVPLGPRVVCVSTFLACMRARERGRKVQVLLPQTMSYRSLRSDGYTDPFVEEVRFGGDSSVVGPSA